MINLIKLIFLIKISNKFKIKNQNKKLNNKQKALNKLKTIIIKNHQIQKVKLESRRKKTISLEQLKKILNLN